MKRFSRAIAVGVALGALGVPLAQAETKSSMKPPTENKMNAAAKPACTMDDETKVRSVMQLIHASNQAEIKTGKLALSKTKNAAVKAYADRMIKDHTEADKKLSDLASKQGIDLNASMADPLYAAAKATSDAQSQMLSGKNGAAFDVAYIVGQPTDHLFVLKVIEEGQKVAKDESKKALDDAHAVVSRHKDDAEKTAGMLQMPANDRGIGGGPKSGDATEPGTMKEDSTKESTTKESTTKESTTKQGTMKDGTMKDDSMKQAPPKKQSPATDDSSNAPIDSPDYQNPMQQKLP